VEKKGTMMKNRIPAGRKIRPPNNITERPVFIDVSSWPSMGDIPVPTWGTVTNEGSDEEHIDTTTAKQQNLGGGGLERNIKSSEVSETAGKGMFRSEEVELIRGIDEIKVGVTDEEREHKGATVTELAAIFTRPTKNSKPTKRSNTNNFPEVSETARGGYDWFGRGRRKQGGRGDRRGKEGRSEGN
jgi:hypothetical protein